MKEINIGRVLIKNRHKRGITQDELANHLGVSKGAVSKWETGHKHLDTTIRYLNVLDDKLRTASQEFYRRYSNLYNVNQFLESRR